MARFDGTNGDDSHRGTRSADEIYGYGGDDWLHGGSGNDRIFGGDGDDGLAGGQGNDRLDGGDGWDAVFYDDATAGVVVNLATGRAKDGLGGTDRLTSIEVVFGSAFADKLTGGIGHDELHGGDGNDRLSGGDGDDLLFGDAGSDVLIGGADADFASYYHLGTSISLDLATGRATKSGGGTDTLSGIEGAYGSQHNDTMAGDHGNNLLVGNGGNDMLYGRDGHDTIDGGDGNDTLWGGRGNDRFVFGPDGIGATPQEADVIVDFGDGADSIDLSAIDANSGAGGNQAFRFIGTSGFTGRAGELRIAEFDGFVFLAGDVNGDRVADGYIRFEGHPAITEAALIL